MPSKLGLIVFALTILGALPSLAAGPTGRSIIRIYDIPGPARLILDGKTYHPRVDPDGAWVIYTASLSPALSGTEYSYRIGLQREGDSDVHELELYFRPTEIRILNWSDFIRPAPSGR